MYCVKEGQTLEVNIKKSRFIGILIPCSTEHEVLTHLKKLNEQHPNANHIAFAYRILSKNGLVTRMHDAGEPSGTAGKPIYQHLEGKNLINLLVAVVRYFGGIKLGAGGLTRAYGNSAKMVLEASKIIEYVEQCRLQLTIEYNQVQRIEYLLNQYQGRIIEQDFSDKVSLIVELPVKHENILIQEISNA